MNRKNRIVCTPVEVDYTTREGKVIKAYVWQQCYESSWLTDCKDWIKRQKAKYPENMYKIFVEVD